MPCDFGRNRIISNANERAQLVSEKRKQATAKSIADGIDNYFKQK